MSLTDLIFNACDSYMDAATCKHYTNAIFNNEACSSTESQGFDAREDCLTIRGLDADRAATTRLRAGKSSEGTVIVDVLRPLLPMGDEHDDDETIRESADRSKDIFRLTKTAKFSGQNEYPELCRLCRCTAWSMDSNCSVMETSSYSSAEKKGAYSTNLVHWDEILRESGQLNSRLVISKD